MTTGSDVDGLLLRADAPAWARGVYASLHGPGRASCTGAVAAGVAAGAAMTVGGRRGWGPAVTVSVAVGAALLAVTVLLVAYAVMGHRWLVRAGTVAGALAAAGEEWKALPVVWGHSLRVCVAAMYAAAAVGDLDRAMDHAGDVTAVAAAMSMGTSTESRLAALLVTDARARAGATGPGGGRYGRLVQP